MKLPKTFLPEKNLDNKICELIKEPENDLSENIIECPYSELDSRVVYNKAKEVAEKLGKLDQTSSAYTFEDEKTRIIIEYLPWYQDQTTHLRIYHQLHTTYLLVFKADKRYTDRYSTIEEVIHIPGNWEESLEKLYKKT